jgi:hypothetical protein
VLLHYGVLVRTVTQRYRYINYVITERLETRKQPTRFCTMNTIKTVGGNAENDMRPPSDFKSQNVSCKPDAIRTFRLIYLKLCDATKLVYSLSGVSVVCNNFNSRLLRCCSILFLLRTE